MTVYRIEIKVAATAYVKADSPLAARAKLRGFVGLEGLPPVSEEMFDSPRLPEVSVSPAMTVLGLYAETEEVDT